jgi:hypothetical protein
MTRLHLTASLTLLALSLLLLTGFNHEQAFWSQWGRNSQHTGMVNIPAQPLDTKLADIVYDDFVNQEKAENELLFGEAVLSVHYQATLVDGDSFYMVKKDGAKYPTCKPLGYWIYGQHCGPNAWNKLEWNVVRYDWKNGKAVPAWKFWTDWKPEPNATDLRFGLVGLAGWEPVFHPALANGFLYVPGAAGTIWKVDKTTGKSVAHVKPFGQSEDATNTFVSGPLTADNQGRIYYNVIKLNTFNGNPWDENDVANAWLVKVTPDDKAASVTYKTLVPDAPPPNSTNCPGTFFLLGDGGASLPWPPTSTSQPPHGAVRRTASPSECGASRRTRRNHLHHKHSPLRHDGHLHDRGESRSHSQVGLQHATSLDRRVRHPFAHRWTRRQQRAQFLPLWHHSRRRPHHQCERFR